MRLTERLGDGLQNHLGQFDSATSLQCTGGKQHSVSSGGGQAKGCEGWQAGSPKFPLTIYLEKKLDNVSKMTYNII